MIFNDVSHHQGPHDNKPRIDWAAHCAVRDMVIVRAHTGFGPDDDWDYNRSHAHANGIKALGIYAYVTGQRDIAPQVNEFLQLVGTLAPNEFLVMDNEDPDLDIVAAFKSWMPLVEAATKRQAVVYFGGQHGGLMLPELTGGRIRWVARYATDPPDCPYDMWQHASNDTAPGVVGNCDESVTGMTWQQVLTRTGGATGVHKIQESPTGANDEDDPMRLVFRAPADGKYWMVAGGSMVHLAKAEDEEAAKKVAKTVEFTAAQLNVRNFLHCLRQPGAYIAHSQSNVCRIVGGGRTAPILPGGNYRSLVDAGMLVLPVTDAGLTAVRKEIK